MWWGGNKMALVFCLREGESPHSSLGKTDGNLLNFGIGLPLTVDETGGFWCPFSCWFSFSQGLGPGRVVPVAPHRFWPRSPSNCLTSDQNQAKQLKKKTQGCWRIAAAVSPALGKGEKRSFFVKPTQNQAGWATKHPLTRTTLSAPGERLEQNPRRSPKAPTTAPDPPQSSSSHFWA